MSCVVPASKRTPCLWVWATLYLWFLPACWKRKRKCVKFRRNACLSYERGKCFPARVSTVRKNSMRTKLIGLQEMGWTNSFNSPVRNMKKYGKIKKDRRVWLVAGGSAQTFLPESTLHFSCEEYISPVELLVARTGKLDEPGRMCREVASIVACLFACFLLALFTFVPSKVPSKVLFTFDGILLTKVFI